MSTGPTSDEGKLKSGQNARMSDDLVEARKGQDDLMAGYLEMFGRKRRPKSINWRPKKATKMPTLP